MNDVGHFLLVTSPVLLLGLGGCVLVLMACFHKKYALLSTALFSLFTLISLVMSVALLSNFFPFNATASTQWYSEFQRHFYADTFTFGWLVALDLFLLITGQMITKELIDPDVFSDALALLLFSGCGIGILVSASSLIMVFLGLEFLSLPVYILVSSRRHDSNSCEAGLKYFLFGSLASVLLLLAIAIVFGACGSLYFSDVERALGVMSEHMGHGTTALALALFISVVGFKLGIAPFHLWLPDAYEGAPTPVTGFMGSAIKLAGLALGLRLFWGPLLPLASVWSPVLITLSIAAMVVGSFGGLVQRNLKRMLAYSSIAHAGYLLLGVAVAPKSMDSYALWFYVLSYGVMFSGLMGAFMLIEKSVGRCTVDSIAGMGFARPVFSLCIVLFVLSAAGIPPLAGFTAKYMVFLQVVQSGHIAAAVCAVISSLVSVYYYLRIIVALYMTETTGEMTSGTTIAASAGMNNAWVFSTIVACALALIVMGLAPGSIL